MIYESSFPNFDRIDVESVLTNFYGNRSRHKCGILCHCKAFFKGRGNLNRYILDCFVVKLLAMTPKTQLIPRERLPFMKAGRESGKCRKEPHSTSFVCAHWFDYNGRT